MNYQDIIKRIPTSWETMKLEQFQKLLDIILVETEDEFSGNLFIGMDNTLMVISRLTDIPVSELEAMPIQAVNEMAKRLDFMTTLPQTKVTSNVIFKEVDEITYNDFVLYSNMAQQPNGVLSNLPLVLQSFAKKKMSLQEVNDLNMVDCFTGFFLSERNTKKWCGRTAKSLKKKIRREMIRALITRFKVMLQNKRNQFKGFMGGFFSARK
jgi:hypothetical protein